MIAHIKNEPEKLDKYFLKDGERIRIHNRSRFIDRTIQNFIKDFPEDEIFVVTESTDVAYKVIPQSTGVVSTCKLIQRYSERSSMYKFHQNYSLVSEKYDLSTLHEVH